MTSSDLISLLGTTPQTARQIAEKINRANSSTEIGLVGCMLFKLCRNGIVERVTEKCDRHHYRTHYYIPRRVDISRYEDIQC